MNVKVIVLALLVVMASAREIRSRRSANSMPMNIEELIPMGMHNIAKRMTDNLQLFAGITSMANNVVRVSRDLIGSARNVADAMGLDVMERIHKRAAGFEEVGRRFKGSRTSHKIEKKSARELKDTILEFTRQLGIAPQ